MICQIAVKLHIAGTIRNELTHSNLDHWVMWKESYLQSDVGMHLLWSVRMFYNNNNNNINNNNNNNNTFYIKYKNNDDNNNSNNNNNNNEHL